MPRVMLMKLSHVGVCVCVCYSVYVVKVWVWVPFLALLRNVHASKEHERVSILYTFPQAHSTHMHMCVYILYVHLYCI